MKNYFLFLLICLSCLSCSRTDTTDNAEPIKINLIAPADSTLLLSSIADSIMYFPLSEIQSERPGLDERITVYLSPNNVWMTYAHYGILYDRNDGTIKKKIDTGSFFNQPSYWFTTMRSNVSITPDENHFYLRKRLEKSGKVYFSDVIRRYSDEQHVDSINLPYYYSIGLNDSLIMGCSSKATLFEPSTIEWYDTHGHLLSQDALLDTLFFDGQIERCQLSVLKNKIYYRLGISSTVYEVVSAPKCLPAFYFDLGKYTPQYHKMKELKNIKPQDYSSLPYYYLTKVQIGNDFIFGTFSYFGKSYHIFSDKQDTYILPVKPSGYQVDNGLINDLDGGLDFWPRNISQEGEIYTWYLTDSLKAKVNRADLSNIKNPTAALKLKKMLDNLPKETNIIVAIMKEKEQ